MNQQNISNTPNVPAKRKRGRPRKEESTRGRPRKDESLRNVKQHSQPSLALVVAPSRANVITTIQQPLATNIPSSNNLSKVDHSMLGQAVTCVIDGIFDNGYLLSTRLGPNNSVLRGIVLQQGHVTSITPANDVAPHVEMCARSEFPIPPSNPRSPVQISTPQSVCEKQPAQPMPMQDYHNTPPMVTGGSSTSAPHESLRLVEQDDIMQVFEVSKTVEEAQDCVQENTNEPVVSDPMAESFPENQPVVNTSPNEQHAKEPEPELITPVETETILENQPSIVNDGLQQETQEQTGEVSNIDANQDPNREVAVDLSLSNFPEI